MRPSILLLAIASTSSVLASPFLNPISDLAHGTRPALNGDTLSSPALGPVADVKAPRDSIAHKANDLPPPTRTTPHIVARSSRGRSRSRYPKSTECDYDCDYAFPSDFYTVANARRLAMGLSLKRPMYHWESLARQAALSSSSTITKRGKILVTNLANGVPLGYITQQKVAPKNHFGVGDSVDALLFSLSVDPEAGGISRVDIAAGTKDTETWPLMGGALDVVDGIRSDDLSSGSANFAYIQATSETAPDSHAVPASNSESNNLVWESAENVIWIYDAATQGITARWVNTDGIPVNASLVYVTQALVLTGDYGVFLNTFGGSGEVTFTFIEA